MASGPFGPAPACCVTVLARNVYSGTDGKRPLYITYAAEKHTYEYRFVPGRQCLHHIISKRRGNAPDSLLPNLCMPQNMFEETFIGHTVYEYADSFDTPACHPMARVAETLLAITAKMK